MKFLDLFYYKIKYRYLNNEEKGEKEYTDLYPSWSIEEVLYFFGQKYLEYQKQQDEGKMIITESSVSNTGIFAFDSLSYEEFCRVFLLRRIVINYREIDFGYTNNSLIDELIEALIVNPSFFTSHKKFESTGYCAFAKKLINEEDFLLSEYFHYDFSVPMDVFRFANFVTDYEHSVFDKKYNTNLFNITRGDFIELCIEHKVKI